MNENIIEVENLNKTFKDIKAIDNLSFRVKRGEFFAFLGINGAGKSTTISIISGELQADSGKVTIDGQDILKDSSSVKNKLGIVFQNNLLDTLLTVYDNLKYRSSLYNVTSSEFKKRIDYYADLLDFKDLYKRTYSKLSGGQKRRIDIARALIHEPSILILDEPTTGLDPMTRKIVWNAIHKLRKERNLTVFLTTHYMEEVVDADYIVILNSGKIIAKGTPLELKNRYTGDYIYIYNSDEETVNKLNLPYTKTIDGFKIEIKDSEEATKLIVNNPYIFKDYEIIKGNMDDVFLNATGNKLSGE